MKSLWSTGWGKFLTILLVLAIAAAIFGIFLGREDGGQMFSLSLAFLEAVAFIAVLSGAAVFGARFWKKKKEAAFDEGMAAKEGIDDRKREWLSWSAELKKQGVDRYDLPFYLLVGEPQSGKSVLLHNSELHFPFGQSSLSGIGGTRGCDWWFAEEAVILDLAGRLFTHEGGAADAAEWEAFLELLTRYRPLCPANGIILVLPCDSLLQDSADVARGKATQIQSALLSLAQTLEAQLPVYLVLTKGDKVFGFAESVHKLDAQERHQMFGWSREAGRFEAPFSIEEVRSGFEGLVARGRALRARMLSSAPLPEAIPEVDRLYAFPEELEALYPALEVYLERVFSSSSLADRFFFRGLYLTSGLQSGAPVAKVCSELLGGTGAADEQDLESLFTKQRSYFIRDLVQKRVFKERGLVRPTKSRVVKARKAAWVAYGLAAALALVALGFCVNYWMTRDEGPGRKNQVVLDEVARVQDSSDLPQLVQAASALEWLKEQELPALAEQVGRDPEFDELYEELVKKRVLPVAQESGAQRLERALRDAASRTYRECLADAADFELVSELDPRSVGGETDEQGVPLPLRRLEALAGSGADVRTLLDRLGSEGEVPLRGLAELEAMKRSSGDAGAGTREDSSVLRDLLEEMGGHWDRLLETQPGSTLPSDLQAVIAWADLKSSLNGMGRMDEERVLKASKTYANAFDALQELYDNPEFEARDGTALVSFSNADAALSALEERATFLATRLSDSPSQTWANVLERLVDLRGWLTELDPSKGGEVPDAAIPMSKSSLSAFVDKQVRKRARFRNLSAFTDAKDGEAFGELFKDFRAELGRRSLRALCADDALATGSVSELAASLTRIRTDAVEPAPNVLCARLAEAFAVVLGEEAPPSDARLPDFSAAAAGFSDLVALRTALVGLGVDSERCGDELLGQLDQELCRQVRGRVQTAGAGDDERFDLAFYRSLQELSAPESSALSCVSSVSKVRSAYAERHVNRHQREWERIASAGGFAELPGAPAPAELLAEYRDLREALAAEDGTGGLSVKAFSSSVDGPMSRSFDAALGSLRRAWGIAGDGTAIALANIDRLRDAARETVARLGSDALNECRKEAETLDLAWMFASAEGAASRFADMPLTQAVLARAAGHGFPEGKSYNDVCSGHERSFQRTVEDFDAGRISDAVGRASAIGLWSDALGDADAEAAGDGASRRPRSFQPDIYGETFNAYRRGLLRIAEIEHTRAYLKTLGGLWSNSSRLALISRNLDLYATEQAVESKSSTVKQLKGFFARDGALDQLRADFRHPDRRENPGDETDVLELWKRRTSLGGSAEHWEFDAFLTGLQAFLQTPDGDLNPRLELKLGKLDRATSLTRDPNAQYIGLPLSSSGALHADFRRGRDLMDLEWRMADDAWLRIQFRPGQEEGQETYGFRLDGPLAPLVMAWSGEPSEGGYEVGIVPRRIEADGSLGAAAPLPAYVRLEFQGEVKLPKFVRPPSNW